MDEEVHENTPSRSFSNEVVEIKGKQQTLHHSSSVESAGTWFDNVNENVQNNDRRQSLLQEEPPFYMTSQKPYRQLPHSGAPSRAFGGASAMVVDSEKEDLRDVIDDLTVENKKLKQKLRSHKSRTSKAPSSRTEDKLIEVRVHGMRADKKRELEVLLKNFATSLGRDTIPSRSNASRSSDQLASISSLSNSGPGGANGKFIQTDSGYGSNSNLEVSRAALPVPPSTRDHTIKSYLHDIPDVLLPRESYHMSDQAKMALVVRRLEQLFTGKQASPGDHHQPIQQQEVSNSAAYADRQEEDTGKKSTRNEGSREAHILPLDTNFVLDVSEAPSPAKSLHSKINSEKPTASPPTSGSGFSRSESPDQRPTRPLDLDIGRAQVAQENIDYIKHLGLSAPGFDQGGTKKEQWIYLNLLVSMAQLHTLNVTPDFIRRAIKKHSTKFELSKDLRSVRWRGGTDTTVFSKEMEQEIEHTSTGVIDAAQGESIRSKNSKTDSGSNGNVSFTPSDAQTSQEESFNRVTENRSNLGTSYSSKPQVLIQSKNPSAFDYKPMFYKRKVSLRHQTSSLDDSTSSAATDSTGLADKMSRSQLSGQNQSGDGMLTFFNNPYFCSDFSADKHPTNYVKHQLVGLVDFTAGVLGISEPIDHEESAYREHDACYFAPQFAAKFTAPKNKKLVLLEPETIHVTGEDEKQPIEMEASGLGMTVPADNFAIDVKVSREVAVGRHSLKPKSRLQKTIPARFEYHVLSAYHIDLQPSQLPSPSYVFFTSSSSSYPDAMDDDSDSWDDSSSANGTSPAPAPHAFTRHLSSDSSGGSGNDESMGGYDSSMDMLQAARAEDPQGVAAREREYLLNHPGAALKVSPSLAATMGTSSV